MDNIVITEEDKLNIASMLSSFIASTLSGKPLETTTIEVEIKLPTVFVETLRVIADRAGISLSDLVNDMTHEHLLQSIMSFNKPQQQQQEQKQDIPKIDMQAGIEAIQGLGFDMTKIQETMGKISELSESLNKMQQNVDTNNISNFDDIAKQINKFKK